MIAVETVGARDPVSVGDGGRGFPEDQLTSRGPHVEQKRKREHWTNVESTH
jgi:hypothetical protein